MILAQRARITRLCSICLCLATLFACGAAGNASAKQLLFVPSTAFPVHLSGSAAASLLLRTSGGFSLSASGGIHALVLILGLVSPWHWRIRLLGSTSVLGSCQTPGDASGVILLNLLGHLGLADPGDKPAVLLLVPGGFSFECGGFTTDLKGAVIGEITAPEILKSGQTSLTVKFAQKEGTQSLTSFLLGATLLTNQFVETNVLGFTSAFEQSGLEAEDTLKPTTGTFEIKDE